LDTKDIINFTWPVVGLSVMLLDMRNNTCNVYFCRNEYYPTDLNMAPVQDISKKEPTNGSTEEDDDDFEPDLDQSQELEAMDDSQSEATVQNEVEEPDSKSDDNFSGQSERRSASKERRRSSIGNIGEAQPKLKRKKATDR
jgi:hypothetical protein